MAAKIKPVFTHVPDDWKGRWELLELFVRRWQNVKFDAADKIAGNEHFPPSVREWFAFVTRVQALQKDNRLIQSMKSPEFTFQFGEFELTDEFIPLLSDDGCRSVYMIPKKFWQNPDPPVHFYDSTSEEDGGLNRKSMSMFALSWILQFSVGFDDSVDFPRKEQISESAGKRAITFLKKNVSKPTTFDDFQIFEKDDLFVAIEPGVRDCGKADGKFIYVFARGEAIETVNPLLKIC